MKVFTGGIVTETNTFAPFPTELADWQTTEDGERFVLEPIFDVIRNSASARGMDCTSGFAAFAEPAGKTTGAAYFTLKKRLFDDLRAAMPVDAVVLVLHGAMVAEGCDDCEGDILADVRDIVGRQTPIGAGLDPHAHLTKKMLANADVLVFMKEWPHIDIQETMEGAFRITADCAEGKINPAMSVFDCRMIAPYHTLEEPVKSFVSEMRAAEKEEGVLSVSLIHGFWYADVPDMGTKMLVVTDNAARHGERLAETFGRQIFALRGKTAPNRLTLEDALDEIEASDAGPAVVADVGDIPGGGAPGDATFVFHGLLDRGIRNAAIAFIWDPASLDNAIAAGVGSDIELSVGGRTCALSGEPIRGRFRVEGIYPDLVVQDDTDTRAIGDVAVVSINGIYVALARSRVGAMSSQYFDQIGIPASDMHLLVIKSANNFYAGFETIAAKVLYVDAGGVTGGRVEDLRLERIARPKWPLDPYPFYFGPMCRLY